MINGTEALAEIVAGMKGVTPGPWWADSERSEGGDGSFNAFAVYGPETRYGHPSSICDTHNSGEIMIERDGDGTPWDEQGRVNMDHIARCDPDTMRAIADTLATKDATIAELTERLERTERNRDMWKGQVERQSAKISTMREAMSKLLIAAKLLQSNSEGCAVNHYGEDFSLHGMPGFLVDTHADIEAAAAVLECKP